MKRFEACIILGWFRILRILYWLFSVFISSQSIFRKNFMANSLDVALSIHFLTIDWAPSPSLHYILNSSSKLLLIYTSLLRQAFSNTDSSSVFLRMRRTSSLVGLFPEDPCLCGLNSVCLFSTIFWITSVLIITLSLFRLFLTYSLESISNFLVII